MLPHGVIGKQSVKFVQFRINKLFPEQHPNNVLLFKTIFLINTYKEKDTVFRQGVSKHVASSQNGFSVVDGGIRWRHRLVDEETEKQNLISNTTFTVNLTHHSHICTVAQTHFLELFKSNDIPLPLVSHPNEPWSLLY